MRYFVVKGKGFGYKQYEQKELYMASLGYPTADLQDKFLITNVSAALTKTKKEYATLQLLKDNEQVEGKIWDWNSGMASTIQTGNVIKAIYRRDTYQGRTQVNILNFTKVEGDISSFMRKATTGTTEELWEEAIEVIATIKDPFVKFVCDELLTHPLIVDNIKTSPAAITVHSNWVSGLLEHGLSMCSMAAAVHRNYLAWAPNLSLSKIIFGCLFHDIGKCIEYSTKGAAYTSTSLGELANHIVFGPALIWEVAQRYPDPVSDLEVAELMHIVASHHGKAEYGSPVPPRTLESIIVHHLDVLDGTFMHAWDTIKGGPVEPGSLFSKQSYFHKTKYFLQEGIGESSKSNESSRGARGDAEDDCPW